MLQSGRNTKKAFLSLRKLMLPPHISAQAHALCQPTDSQRIFGSAKIQNRSPNIQGLLFPLIKIISSWQPGFIRLKYSNFTFNFTNSKFIKKILISNYLFKVVK